MQHAVNWFEIPVADLSRAIKFYEAMTGAKLRREAFGAPGEEMGIFVVDSEETGISGCLLSSPDAKPAQAGTTVYLNAEPSIDTWIDRAQKAGAQIITPKTALPPGMGFFAHILDSEGNRVGLHALA
ncbi:VOC family protein [Variovorax sp. PCZ-1]|uniref:VOC family protein n=1 Tax=Variovorax sp. PCZ-1 TaxID=2835533 RepID=UPI001BCFD1CF|nr:VOC family protein [Variovorax sp. PCZ-1]MBS7807754.1 VOC family protein [Variovorax sp. PCZ-1]